MILFCIITAVACALTLFGLAISSMNPDVIPPRVVGPSHCRRVPVDREAP